MLLVPLRTIRTPAARNPSCFNLTELNNENRHQSNLRFRPNVFGRSAERLLRSVFCGPDQNLGVRNACTRCHGQSDTSQGGRSSNASFKGTKPWILWHRQHVSARSGCRQGRHDPEVKLIDDRQRLGTRRCHFFSHATRFFASFSTRADPNARNIRYWL